jgi:hypothetical protein
VSAHARVLDNKGLRSLRQNCFAKSDTIYQMFIPKIAHLL